MDFDLSRSGSKLKREQERRREEAKRKQEKERQAQEQARVQKEALEKIAEQRRLEALAREEEARQREQEELILTSGIKFSEELLAVDAEGEGDKIFLPPSALQELSTQDALSRGPMFFRVSLEDGSRMTHAGVLEFMAAEGTVGLPLKVRRSLGQEEEGQPLGKVKVKYVRLEKGKYVKLQPKTGALSQVPELKHTLEMNLTQHATLTKGDFLQVWYRGKAHDLKVVELSPEPQVTVIDTDIEVDLDLSEDMIRREEQKRASDAVKTLGGSPERPTTGNPTTTTTTPITNSRGRQASPLADMLKGGRGPPMSSSPPPLPSVVGPTIPLPPEPPADDPQAVNVLVRKPEGGQMSRRFLRSAPLQGLFDFVDSSYLPTLPPPYRLVTRFPRRVFTRQDHGAQSFDGVGLTGKQEALMLELV